MQRFKRKFKNKKFNIKIKICNVFLAFYAVLLFVVDLNN